MRTFSTPKNATHSPRRLQDVSYMVLLLQLLAHATPQPATKARNLTDGQPSSSHTLRPPLIHQPVMPNKWRKSTHPLEPMG